MNKIEDYRELLRSELGRRQQINPAYSSRAFARDLGLTPAYLVQLFAGRKNLSENRAAEIIEQMPWSDSAKQKFWLTFKIQRSQKSLRAKYEQDLKCLVDEKGSRNLSKDEFSLVADWHHYAIVELLRTDANLDRAAIGKRLQLSPRILAAALSRLKRLGLLKQAGGKFVVNADFYTSGDVPSVAIRRNHIQHLDLARAAIEKQSVDKRDFSGVTVAIDPKLLPEASRRIREFRRQLMKFLESGEKSEVYRLNVQLFRLDQEIE